ncbi:MAG: hypothetical protein ACJAS9_002334 [Polaribacter sp.]|jgi:hypothetical protein
MHNHRRVQRLDAVKGILELLIVLEHNLLITSVEPGLRPIVNSFCVGCFMLLTFTREVKDTNFLAYINKYYRYLIPYFFFLSAATVLNFFIFNDLSLSQHGQSYAIALLWQSTNFIKEASGFAFFWFIPCLCFIYFLRYLHLRIGWPFLVLMAFCNMFIGLIHEDTLAKFPFGAHVAFFLYFIGCVYQKIHHKFSQDDRYGLFAFCLFSLLILINPLIPPGLLMFAGIMPTIFETMQYAYYFTILLFSYPGILYLTRIIPKKITDALAFCGRYSIWIYLSHQMFYILLVDFLHISNNGPVVFTITIILSCITSVIIDKIPIFKALLLPRSISQFFVNMTTIVKSPIQGIKALNKPIK